MWEAVGVSHGLTGKPVCQDYHLLERLDNDVLAIAVSDGAGSALHAEIGSETACRAAIGFLKDTHSNRKLYDENALDIVLAGVKAARKAVEEEASRRKLPVRDFSATFVLVLSIGSTVTVAQVGDCMVVAETQTGEVIALTTPSRGEYANETTMLTSADALKSINSFQCCEPIQCIAVMTDGLLPITTIAPFYRPSVKTFPGLFAYSKGWSNREEAIAELTGFLTSDRVQQGTGDDLTLVLARRR